VLSPCSLNFGSSLVAQLDSARKASSIDHLQRIIDVVHVFAPRSAVLRKALKARWKADETAAGNTWLVRRNVEVPARANKPMRNNK
jgi:hypothetical protein